MKRLLTLTLGLAVMAFLASPASADTFYNLQTDGAAVNVAADTGGAGVATQGPIGSGTGVFPAFVQITGGGVEDAYNTTTNGTNDNGASDNFNYALTKGDLAAAIVTYQGNTYYEFFLDINESNNSTDTYLSLDEIRIYASATTNNPGTEPYPSPATLVWQMQADAHILLLYDLEAGSGYADMTLLVPTSILSSYSDSAFVYLYSLFGELADTCTTAPCVSTGDYGGSDGFEEWAYNREGGTVTIPDGGSTLGLLGLGMLALGYARRRFGKF